MTGRTLAQWAEGFGALLHGPKTVREISEYTGANVASVLAMVTALHESGVVYICEHRPTLRDGRQINGPSRVYALQPKPYHHEDAVYTPRRPPQPKVRRATHQDQEAAP